MRFPILAIVAATLMLTVIAPVAGAVDVTMSAKQAERYQTLTHELRCPACQNQPIATSDASISVNLRRQVARQIVAGRTNAEIEQYMVARYGQSIRYDPPFQWATALLWCGPFALLALGLGLIYRLTRRRGRESVSNRPTLNRQRLAAVLAESSTESGHTPSRETSRND